MLDKKCTDKMYSPFFPLNESCPTLFKEFCIGRFHQRNIISYSRRIVVVLLYLFRMSFVDTTFIYELVDTRLSHCLAVMIMITSILLTARSKLNLSLD